MSYDLSKFKLVGQDVFVSDNVEIRRPHLVTIGNHIAIDSGFYITTRAEIGNHIHIGPYVAVIGGEKSCLKMGNFTNIAVGGRILCGSDSFTGDALITAPGIPAEYTSVRFTTITFENFVNVGASVVIFPGVTLREGCVIGAGSVVTKDTDPWTVYIGNPARPVRSRPKEKMLEYAQQLGY